MFLYVVHELAQVVRQDGLGRVGSIVGMIEPCLAAVKTFFQLFRIEDLFSIPIIIVIICACYSVGR